MHEDRRHGPKAAGPARAGYYNEALASHTPPTTTGARGITPAPNEPSSRILVVEDEGDLLEVIAFHLRRSGHTPILASDGAEGLALAQRERPDLVILDLMLPTMNGLDVAERLRRKPTTASIPILMLTALADERDQLVGLAIGADDYVTKPFSIPVLLARVEAVLRRAGGSAGVATTTVGAVTVNMDTHETLVDGAPAPLTGAEFKLLTALMQANGRALTRKELISRVMGAGVRVTDRAIDVHLAAIRKKLGGHGALIRTVRGVGYRMTAGNEPAMSRPARRDPG